MIKWFKDFIVKIVREEVKVAAGTMARSLNDQINTTNNSINYVNYIHTLHQKQLQYIFGKEVLASIEELQDCYFPDHEIIQGELNTGGLITIKWQRKE